MANKAVNSQSKKSFKFRLSEFFSTFIYVGKIPFAPGTFGSIVATFLVVIIIYQPYNIYLESGMLNYKVGGGYIASGMILPLLIMLSVASFVFGERASQIYSEIANRNDPKEVVIDEVCGIFLSFSLVGLGFAALMAINMAEYVIYFTLSFYYIIAIFILFRIFDILKPHYIGRLDKKFKNDSARQGFGIMIDDVLCAPYVAVSFFVIFFALKYAGVLDELIKYKG